jgi:hypothetical protein
VHEAATDFKIQGTPFRKPRRESGDDDEGAKGRRLLRVSVPEEIMEGGMK